MDNEQIEWSGYGGCGDGGAGKIRDGLMGMLQMVGSVYTERTGDIDAIKPVRQSDLTSRGFRIFIDGNEYEISVTKI